MCEKVCILDIVVVEFFSKNVESSKIPPEWHSWIHFTTRNMPTKNLIKFSWQKEHQENLTGTKNAYKPDGALSSNLKKNNKKYETWKI